MLLRDGTRKIGVRQAHKASAENTHIFILVQSSMSMLLNIVSIEETLGSIFAYLDLEI